VNAWDFIVSLLAGAAASIIIGLLVVGRYQQKIDSLECAIPELQRDVKEALKGIARLQGELSRINGRKNYGD
jgi:hypothetical protein